MERHRSRFICPICSTSFTLKYNLFKHNRSKHRFVTTQSRDAEEAIQVYYVNHPLVLGCTSGTWMTQKSDPIKINRRDIKQIHEMFPSLTKEVIVSTLQAFDGNKTRTINVLLEMCEEN